MVGQTKWVFGGPSEKLPNGRYNLTNPTNVKLGHLDGRASYYMDMPINGEFSFKCKIGTVTDLVVCGSNYIWHLKDVQFLIDINGTTNVRAGGSGNGTVYTPSPNRVVWKQKKYIGKECKMLYNLPRGEHVISVRSNFTR